MNYGIVDTDSGGEGIGGGISKPPDGNVIGLAKM
jgi:hypothetical protein